MTVTEILDTARDLYNASSDTFFTDTQMYNWLWKACNVLATKAYCIEASSSVTTVAGTQNYVFPTNAFAIKRVVYNGRKLKRVTFREDDSVTLANSTTTQQGASTYYYEWNGYIYLRPIPDSAVTLTWYTYNLQAAISSGATTPSIPTEFHMDTVEYLLYCMFSKDKDSASANVHRDAWMQAVQEAIRSRRMRRRSDSFATVQDEDSLPSSVLGEV